MPDDNKNLRIKDRDWSRPSSGNLFLLTYAIVLAIALLNINNTMSFFMWVISILTPFLLGIFFAFIINIMTKQLDRHLFKRLNYSKSRFWKKAGRSINVFCSYILVFLMIAAVFSFIIPQIISSINTLVNNLPGYASSLQKITMDLMTKYDITLEQAFSWTDLAKHVTNMLTNVVTNLPDTLVNFAGSLSNFFFNLAMGFIFSVYLLVGKDKILFNIRKVITATLPKRVSNKIYEVAHDANSTFSNFVVGQLTEAIILGTMYFIGASIFRMPYAPLISTMMAVCSLIPLFGIFIGSVPSVLILLMVNPTLALIFIIMVIVFQQIEGNFIYPHVVGGSIGLPGIWVLLSIIVGGALFGAFGMILAVPIASILYSLLSKSVNKRLKLMGLDPYTLRESPNAAPSKAVEVEVKPIKAKE